MAWLVFLAKWLALATVVGIWLGRTIAIMAGEYFDRLDDWGP